MGWSPRPAVSDSHDPPHPVGGFAGPGGGSAAPTLWVPPQELSDAGGTSSATVATPCGCPSVCWLVRRREIWKFLLLGPSKSQK